MDRIKAAPTQRIDRDKIINFTFEGQAMQGLAGDSVAAALFANDVTVCSRSLKYHRPRGLYSLDGETSNTLMRINGEPNVRAEQIPLKEGMVVEAQNYKGSVEKDKLGFLDKFDDFMTAGFYYRFFHKPAFIWPMARKRMRQMAGVGEVNQTENWDDRKFAELYPKAEVVVIGGGPAGLSAALAAAEQGLRVILFEGRSVPGGFYDWRVREYEGQPLYERAASLVEKVLAQEKIRVFTSTFVMNVNGDNLVTAIQMGGDEDYFDQRYVEVRSESVVVASGCIERPLIYEHNDLPGTMQVGAALRLARTYGLKPGEAAVFSIGDDLGLEAAWDLKMLGVNVLACADARPEGTGDDWLRKRLKYYGIEYLPGWSAVEAQGCRKVEGVVLGELDGGETKKYACDLVVASAGLSPLVGPLATAGAKLAHDDATGFFLPDELPPRIYPAGRLLGLTDPKAVEASGTAAGCAAAFGAGVEAAESKMNAANSALEGLPGPAAGCNVVINHHIHYGKKAFICFDEDGTYKAAKQSAMQGMDMPELAKRFGGFGLGPAQYGAPGANLPLVMAQLKGGDAVPAPTTMRAPLVPPLFAAVAGPNHDIFKRTALHDDQIKLGGQMRRIGVWKRARFFSDDHTCKDEILNIRNNVGLIDVSTLGKFRIHGPDALKALQRVYISDMSKTVEGKLKYSAMLNEDGCLLDDGVVTKVGENDYYLTTSTGRAGQTIEWFRYHTRFDGCDFHMVNLTDALGAINLAGPKAQEVFQKVVKDDLGSFPYMGFREMEINGQVTAKVLRVGFVGEASFEIHAPASALQSIWDWLMEAGSEFGIKPFGLEAQSCLRLEKGHVIIGQESEARVNLRDLGMVFLWDRKDVESNKVGAPALRFTEVQPDRLKLTGFEIEGDKGPKDGSVVYQGNKIMGHVCTTRFSYTLNKIIGLALVQASQAKPGGEIQIYQNDGREEERFTAKTVKPHFYDPKGLRLRN